MHSQRQNHIFAFAERSANDEHKRGGSWHPTSELFETVLYNHVDVAA